MKKFLLFTAFVAALAGAATTPVRAADETGDSKLSQDAKTVGAKIKEDAHVVGEKVKTDAKKVGEATKDAAHTVAQDAVKGAHAVAAGAKAGYSKAKETLHEENAGTAKASTSTAKPSSTP